jgi:putative ABC transport system permease protein
MLKNYVRIAFRNLRKHKGYSFINIAGLAIGMACFLLIFMHISDELSYDKFHQKAERVYRVTYEINLSGSTTYTAQTPAPLGPAMVRDYPEVENATRFFILKDVPVTWKDKRFYENVLLGDENIFDVFSFPLLKGNPETALAEPNSLMLTEKMAEKYFGSEDPLNKRLTVNENQDFKVTGVLKDIPRNSHLHFDFLVSFAAGFQNKKMMEYWGNIFYYNYLLLEKGASPVELEKKFPDFAMKYIGGNFKDFFGDKLDQVPSMYKFHLQPLTKIHLHSHLDSEIEPNSNGSYIYVFSAIAFFILLIACINFMNLSTARSSIRAKEIGMRKVIGARRGELIKQFLGESLFLSFLSLIVAIGLVKFSLPFFNSLSGKELSLVNFGHWIFPAVLIGTFVFVGVLAGSYPAFLLSAFIPVEVLKGKKGSKISVPFIRTGLVILQFTISIILIVGTITIHNQMMFIRNKNLGFDKEYLITILDQNRRVARRYETFKDELLKHPDIISVSASSGVPSGIFSRATIVPENAASYESTLMPIMSVDYDFIHTYGIEIVLGRNFSNEFSTDLRGAYVINEAAAEKFGWDSPLGKTLKDTGGIKASVIGVVRNFHFNSLHENIEPLALFVNPNFFRYFALRIRSQNIPQTISHIEKTWKKFAPGRAFEYSFLDDQIDRFYRSEQRLKKIFLYFTVLAIFIACLGLFGLTSFTAEQRTKEIAIRKVFGASTSSLVNFLSKEFAKWVMLANCIAWPVSYFVMNTWLRNFAYRTGISFWIFLLAAILSLGIALLTVSYQSIKAAVSNPVDSLRYE